MLESAQWVALFHFVPLFQFDAIPFWMNFISQREEEKRPCCKFDAMWLMLVWSALLSKCKSRIEWNGQLRTANIHIRTRLNVFFFLPPDMAECRQSGCPWQEQVCNICKSGANQKAPQKLVAWHGMNAVKVISISGKALLPATKKKNVCTAIYVSCNIYRDYVVLIWMQLHFVYSLLRCCMRWQRSNRINMNNWNVRLNAVRQ